MGNCQAVDAATLVIQHPNGKVDKFYWPVNASEIMKSNPGHYVALLLSTTLYPNQNSLSFPNKPTAAAAAAASSAAAAATAATPNNPLRITRIKLLRPTDTLLLGHAYRLITSQEVLCAKKQAKHSKNHQHPPKRSELEKDYQVSKNEKNRGKTSLATGTGTGTGSNSGRSKTWQPKLNSISEAGS